MGTHSLPDTYTLGPQAYDPWALGVYIRQIPHAHVTTITCSTGGALLLKSTIVSHLSGLRCNCQVFIQSTTFVRSNWSKSH